MVSIKFFLVALVVLAALCSLAAADYAVFPRKDRDKPRSGHPGDSLGGGRYDPYSSSGPRDQPRKPSGRGRHR